MTDPTCTATNCGRPADGYLCHGCTDSLRGILTGLPAQLDDLATTITRQAKTSRRGGGKPTKASEAPIPFDAFTADLLQRTRNGLTTWVRHLCEARGIDVPMLAGTRARYQQPPRGPVCASFASTIQGIPDRVPCSHDSCTDIRLQRMPKLPDQPTHEATWLADHIDSIRQDEWAGQLLTELKQLRAELQQAVDNRETKFAGQCTAVLGESEVSVTAQIVDSAVLIMASSKRDLGERVCGAPLRMRPGSKVVKCRECAAEYPSLEISRRILVAAQDYQGTATFIANALTDAGWPITADRIWKWAQRSREAAVGVERYPIIAWSENDLGEPQYRLADIWERLKAGRGANRAERMAS